MEEVFEQNGDEMKKAMVLLSGGQDSTTCLYWAKANFDEVRALGFDYGQSHAVELAAAKEIAAHAGVPYEVVDLRGALRGSSLLGKGNHSDRSSLDPSLPASFLPGRNLTFLCIAASWAAEFGARDIVTGVCETDYSGYPDCRRATMDALVEALNLGIANGFHIHTPLMHLTKAETFRLAKELGCLDVVIQKTITDYNGNMTMNEWGMGEESNPASALRAKGYREAAAKGWL